MNEPDEQSVAGPVTEERPKGESEAMTLESFVAELHSEGVEAGQQEAQALVRAAEEEAEGVLRRARAEAEALLEEARKDAEEAGTRGRAELELAVRDAILQLQAALTAVLGSLVTGWVEDQLVDPDQLKVLLKEVVGSYARSDATGRPEEFKLPAEAATALESWWADELRAVVGGDHGDAVPELSGTLAAAGFEYRVGGATVDVSVESVVEKLMELVRPGLRDVIEEVAGTAVAETPASSPDTDGAARPAAS